MSTATLGIRRSLADIQADYDAGNTAELTALMRAWKGIKELPADNPNSFFMIGGFHGEPFRDNGATDPAWWGGFCQHGTVLFPSWHRAYLFTLEKALQSIPGCESVMLPFWDECSAQSRATGIPTALTDETFVLDGVTIPNPLRSFVFPVAIVDEVTGDNQYVNPPEPSREVGLKTNWLRAEDLYVIADSVNPKTKVVYVKVLVKPLVNLIWIAGIVFVLGSLVALWPDAREQRRLVTRLAPARA